MPKLLAMDLSSNVGHAVLERGRVPLFGTLPLKGNDLATRLGAYLTWLEDMHVVHRFDAISWERPLLTPKDTVDKLELLYGLVGVAYAYAGKHELPWCEVTVEDAKFALCGAVTKVDAEGRRRKIDKDDMLTAAMSTLNWKVATHHEADAGGVGLCAYERLWPKEAA